MAGATFMDLWREKAMRARGTGSVYQRLGHDARWHLKYYDGRGKPHYESAPTRVDAERLLRRRLGEVAQGRRLVGRERERTTFDDLERLIVDDYRLRGRKSLDSVCQSFRALRRVFGGRRASDIGYEDLTGYAAGRGAAPSVWAKGGGATRIAGAASGLERNAPARAIAPSSSASAGALCWTVFVLEARATLPSLRQASLKPRWRGWQRRRPRLVLPAR